MEDDFYFRYLPNGIFWTKIIKFIVYKSCVVDDFFVLSTGIAGEILQKFINYRKKLAIVGDYSKYTSKPLKDFIYESNNGNSIYCVPSVEEALLKLDSAK
jgi:hypothetical protein